MQKMSFFSPGILTLAFPERANTRFAPTIARESALNVGANLGVRPKILQYFFYPVGNLAKIRIPFFLTESLDR